MLLELLSTPIITNSVSQLTIALHLMKMTKLASVVVPLFVLTVVVNGKLLGQSNEPIQSFGYVEVRPNAQMFWWLYESSDNSFNGRNDLHDDNVNNKPLVLWLQGGPGASSTGFGNFGEIGPLDVNLNIRNETWLKHANLLFVDNPVGTGYSYVTTNAAYVTTNDEIAKDLMVLISEFYAKNTKFQETPLYIFGESYGGKMVATFALHLNQAIKDGKIKANLKGVAFGDSWISPIDSTETWSSYLYALSLIDSKQKKEIDVQVKKIRKAIKEGKGRDATTLWLKLEDLIEKQTNGINWYNILQDEELEESPALKFRKWFLRNTNNILRESQMKQVFTRGVHRHVKFLNDPLDDFMNSEAMKKKLNIPANVTWGGQSADVFNYLSNDFMNPVINDVEIMLNETNLSVNVYTGQLDLIVDSIGTENWVSNMNWNGINNFNMKEKSIFVGKFGSPKAFVKREKNFSFYWILKAGHMIPSDASSVSIEMLKDIIKV